MFLPFITRSHGFLSTSFQGGLSKWEWFKNTAAHASSIIPDHPKANGLEMDTYRLLSVPS